MRASGEASTYSFFASSIGSPMNRRSGPWPPSLTRSAGIAPSTAAAIGGVSGGSAAATMRSEERRVGKSVSVRVDLGGRRIIKKKIYRKESTCAQCNRCNVNTARPQQYILTQSDRNQIYI